MRKLKIMRRSRCKEILPPGNKGCLNAGGRHMQAPRVHTRDIFDASVTPFSLLRLLYILAETSSMGLSVTMSTLR